jgi:hypothetical protein
LATRSPQTYHAAMAILGYITLTFEVFPERRQFVSRCRELDVASCGDSIGEAIEAIHDAVRVYLDAIEQLGERQRIFAEKGIEVRKTKPREVHVESDGLPPNSFTGKVVLPLAA